MSQVYVASLQIEYLSAPQSGVKGKNYDGLQVIREYCAIKQWQGILTSLNLPLPVCTSLGPLAILSDIKGLPQTSFLLLAEEACSSRLILSDWLQVPQRVLIDNIPLDGFGHEGLQG